MQTKQFILPIFILLSLTAFTQSLTLDWAFTTGSTANDGILSITSDSAGNIYSTGYFEDVVDFKPGSGLFNLSSGGNPSWYGKADEDIFIQKLDPQGNLLWAKRIQGKQQYNQRGSKIKVTDNGDIYILGSYRGGVHFILNDTTLWRGSNMQDNAFVLKLNSQGVFQYAVAWKSNFPIQALGIRIDSQGNAYVAGRFKGSLNFNRTDTTRLMPRTSQGDYDMFLAKIDSVGKIKRVKTWGSTGDDAFIDIDLDEHDHLYLSGGFESTVDFDPKLGVVNKTSNGEEDAFVLKLDTSLNFKWVQTFGGFQKDAIIGLNYRNGNIYCNGNFHGTVDFDPSPSNIQNKSAFGASDVFISKLDTAGLLIWVETFGSIKNEYCYGIHVDDFGKVFTIGIFKGTVDFDSGTNTEHYLKNKGLYDSFIQVLDSSGNYLGAAVIGSSSYEFVFGIISRNQGITVGGYFSSSTLDVDPGYGVTNRTNAGGDDIMLLNLNYCNFTTRTFTRNACLSYTLPSGSRTVYTSGTYFDTISNVLGCDSQMTIHVNIGSVDTSVTQTGVTLTAQDTNGHYKWIDCATGVYQDTNKIFTPKKDGDYAVIVTDGYCTDTSGCYSVQGIGIKEINGQPFKLYPNPTTGLLKVEAGNLTLLKIEVYDLQGRLVISKNNAKVIDLSFLQSGMYLVKVYLESGVYTGKVLKE